MRRFYLDKKPGIHLTMAIEAPSFQNTIIREVDEQGNTIGILPYLPGTAYRYNPEPHPQYRKKEKIITPKGEVPIPTLEPKDTIASGENPYVQLIYNYVDYYKRCDAEDIIRYLLNEKRVLPKNKYGIRRAKAYIYQMTHGELAGLLVESMGKYITHIPLKTGERHFSLKEGYDQFEYYIMQYAEYKATLSRSEIHRLMTEHYGWARKPTTIDYYITKLVKQGNLQQIEKNWFIYKKTLQPFQ